MGGRARSGLLDSKTKIQHPTGWFRMVKPRWSDCADVHSRNGRFCRNRLTL